MLGALPQFNLERSLAHEDFDRRFMQSQSPLPRAGCPHIDPDMLPSLQAVAASALLDDSDNEIPLRTPLDRTYDPVGASLGAKLSALVLVSGYSFSDLICAPPRAFPRGR